MASLATIPLCIFGRGRPFERPSPLSLAIRKGPRFRPDSDHTPIPALDSLKIDKQPRFDDVDDDSPERNRKLEGCIVCFLGGLVYLEQVP